MDQYSGGEEKNSFTLSDIVHYSILFLENNHYVTQIYHSYPLKAYLNPPEIAKITLRLFEERSFNLLLIS